MSRSNIHEVPETRATFERQLDNGVQLKYQMSVLQQPERARACGMGAKSHADRRPVDPPPVVELRLFHVTADGGETDVTFQHNSNFFLYASLELARPVAHARGMPAPPPSPVLTGVPVSGMAYLDRPMPAGYFIFPDLSVRHEGRYRLRFALYEDTKEQQATNDPHEPREYCVHRLDVKSRPFTVFSAKKFPGLAESTSLSRIVAEQGCRVRIRRDVRMRRRNDRPRGRESEDSLDETALMRAQRGRSEDYDMDERMSQPPPPPPPHIPTQYRQPNPPYSMHQQEAERKRSVSDTPNNSVPDTPRYNGQYAPPAANHGSYPPPPPTPAPAPQHSNTGYAPSNHSIPPPTPTAPQYQAPPAPSQSYDHSRPQNGYHAPPPPPPPPHHGYGSKDSLSVPGQVQRRESVGDYASRRESDAGYHNNTQYRPATPQPPTHQQYGPHGYNSQQPQQQYSYGPPQHTQAPPPPQQTQQPAASLPPVRLPPISDTFPVPPPGWSSQPTTPSTAAPPPPPPPQPSTNYQPRPPRHAPPPPPPINPAQVPTPSPAQFPSYYPEQNKYNPPPTPAPAETSKKRQWGRVFNPAHTEGALRSGMRPDTESDVYGAEPYSYVTPDNDDDAYDIGKLRMSYRRADGCEIIRKLHGDL